MLSTLDLINHYLGYINVNAKLKGRIYTVLALVGDLYILYLAFSYFKNHAYLRSALLGAAFLGILYFAIVNFYYYFTSKRMKFDVSPYIAKVLGEREAADIESNVPEASVQFVPSNGIYNHKDVLPATVELDDATKSALNDTVQALQDNQLVPADYQGMTDEQQLALLDQGQSKVYANGEGIPLPYYRLEQEPDGLAVYGGLNEMSAKRLGIVKEVGLQPVEAALEKYDLYIATALLRGGPAHVKGRSGLTEIQDPYDLKVELAYKKKD
ncbi:hypothetical protein D3P96_04180 [Weissella viridescens]|uniref:Uncharacterized protein n=1 Tax=Weissella viridescens TaxID=1629 RepID=A0A3P2RHA1_WEIVI|nr:DUF6681 family protein [Weissella viridescens]RRG18130.1 hypothetical protein D3P96_04180 [Weissella viridescens]